MCGPGTIGETATSDFEEGLRAELVKALAEPDQTFEVEQQSVTQDNHQDNHQEELQGTLKEKESQEDGLKGHWEDELNEYLTDMSSKSSRYKKRPTPSSPSTTYKAWKAKAHRRTRQHRRFNNNPYSILDCPWPFCREPFLNEDAVFDHYHAHHPLYIENPGSKKPLQCPFCIGQRYGPKASKLMRGHQNREHGTNRWAQTGEGAERVTQEALAGQDGGTFVGEDSQACVQEALPGQADMLVNWEEPQACGQDMGVGVKIEREPEVDFE